MLYDESIYLPDLTTEVVVEGRPIRYIGSLPEEKMVFFTGTDRTSVDGIHSLYQSVLEAVMHGYDCGYVPGTSYGNAVEKAMEDIGEGRLFCFIPRGLATIPRRTISNALLTGGGILSLSKDEDVFSLDALNRIKELGAYFSDVTILSEETLKMIPPFVQTVLDNGKQLALFKSALRSSGLRTLGAEGCPLIQSFSDLLAEPRFFTYPMNVGKYGILGLHFGIMDRQYGKW